MKLHTHLTRTALALLLGAALAPAYAADTPIYTLQGTGATSPTWSPDGQRIAFNSSLTMSELLKDSLVNPGKKIPTWSLEKPGFSDNSFLTPPKSTTANPDGSLAEIRAYLAKDVIDKKAKVINRLNFINNNL